MKKLIVISLSLAVWSSLLLVGATVWAQQPIRMRYASFWPPTHDQSMGQEDWCKEVNKRTDGRVKIDFYPGGTLIPPAQTYDSIVKGIGDIGFVMFSYTRGKFPLTEVLELPLGIKDAKTATKLANAYFMKFKPKEFDEVKVLYIYASIPKIIDTKKPIAKLEDLKGIKFRCTGLDSKVVEKLGGVPVGMPISEAYDALSKGVVDGTVNPAESLEMFKLAPLLKYQIENFSSAGVSAMAVVMNKSKWNALPKDIQSILENMDQEWTEKMGRLWDEMETKAKKYIVNSGMQIVKLPPEEDARWKQAVQPLLTEYVQTMKAKGLPGEAALNFCIDFLKKQ